MEKEVKYDVEGSEVMSQVLLDLLNQCPALKGRHIAFATLGEDDGLAFFPSTGAAVKSEKQNIFGDVLQVCAYPFDVVLRGAPKTEAQRMRSKELLDTLGKWMEQQPIMVKDVWHKLEEYPKLEGNSRKIKTVSRTTPAHLNAVYQNGTEDWLLSGSLQYENEFNR